MPQIVLGPTLPGRYPRWGYIDRLESNPAMPRALAATLALVIAAGIGISGTRRFWPSGDALVLVESRELTGVQITPFRISAPPLVYKTKVDPMPAPREKQGVIVPVDDADVVTDEISGEPGAGNAPGVVSGICDGETWDGLTHFGTTSGESESFIVVEQEPQLVWMQSPEYPEIARDAGIEGRVLVRALVGEDGSVQKVLLIQSVLGLDEAALEAGMTAVFRPALQQGRPMAVWVVIPIDFSLRGPGLD
ncbi:MAG TPA: energy transducer TonB [Candidatus Krumholzibacteria bacterium]|nr:energy transducer TonB [Candidatus Krumholzibacteria bacterium]